MKVISGETLQLTDIPQLDAATAANMRDEVRSNLAEATAIEIDLSKTHAFDSFGIGGLVALHKIATDHNGGVPIRVVNPTASMQQLLEMTRLHRLFEIVKR